MRNLLAVLILQILITAAVFSSESSVKHEKIPAVTDEMINMSIDFLLSCKYFRKEWPEAFFELADGEDINVIVPKVGEPQICARYLNSGPKDYIFMYPASWLSSGCYDKSAMQVLSHEILHQVGLPPHYIRDYTEYIIKDPIEIVMRHCKVEAMEAKRPLYWPLENYL